MIKGLPVLAAAIFAMASTAPALGQSPAAPPVVQPVVPQVPAPPSHLGIRTIIGNALIVGGGGTPSEGRAIRQAQQYREQLREFLLSLTPQQYAAIQQDEKQRAVLLNGLLYIRTMQKAASRLRTPVWQEGEGAGAPSSGVTVYSPSECIGPIIMGQCKGSILPNGSNHPTCHGQMLNGMCTGPMF